MVIQAKKSSQAEIKIKAGSKMYDEECTEGKKKKKTQDNSLEHKERGLKTII